MPRLLSLLIATIGVLFSQLTSLAQLTAEGEVKRYVKGVGTVVEWVKVRERNEAFDLSVYCLAALYLLGPRFVATIGAKKDATPP